MYFCNVGHTIFTKFLEEKEGDAMQKFIIKPTEKLCGTVKISGAKNAVLPILAACILTDDICEIQNVPPLSDVEDMIVLLTELGANIQFDRQKETIRIQIKELKTQTVPYETAGKMRASFLVAGPLLARCQKACISLPGGCQIGSRPVDLHLKGFALLGAWHKMEHGYVELGTKNGLKGKNVYLDFPSVGATENIMMAAVLTKGTTVIENAAAEPEICDLAEFLVEMGADIQGYGTDTIVIKGVKQLHGTTHKVIPDRIEAGTFMVAAAITGGDIVLQDIQEEHLKPVIAKLTESNVKTEMTEKGLRVYRKGKLKPIQLKTMPFPGFPTDMQAVFMSLAAVAKGTSVITETVFENRFLHTAELQRMGADIKIDSRSAVIEGVDELTGTKVKATDLRAGAALILSALAAKGETEISDIYHIERGYYHIAEKLCALGADIQKKESS